MPSDLEFTGERFVPGIPGEIAHEHWHRYAFVRRFVTGRRVLDAACGEGYGTAHLARSAAHVDGVDLDAAAIDHARATYGDRANVEFTQASVTALPFPDGAFDAVVSFETIEHLPAAAQRLMLDEFDRVLAPDGVLLLSSPNRPEYSEARAYHNPFHEHELDRVELEQLLDKRFPARAWYRQRRYLGSALWSEAGGVDHETLVGSPDHVIEAALPQAMYFVVMAARMAAALPSNAPRQSFFTDSAESEWQRIEAQAREVLRLDDLLKSRDASLDRQTWHIQHLERLVAERERVIHERGAQVDEANAARMVVEAKFRQATDRVANLHEELDAIRREAQAERVRLEGERAELERAITAQERIIAYRQSARWWMKLPWLRVRMLFERVRVP